MTTTPEPTCAGCPGCGGPDCIERPEPVTPEQEAELRRLATMHGVRGYCPACGGSSLFLGDGGYVTCSRIDCPVPDAASTLLETDPRTTAEAPATNPCRADGLHRFATHDIEVCDRDRARATAERAAHEEHRRSLALLHDLPAHADWLQVTAAVTATLRDLAAERAAHEAHRLAVSDALGLGTGAPWDAITDRARQVTADLDAARAGDAPWIRAHREDLEDAKKHAKEAEATIARVRDAVVQWRGWNPTENAWAIRDIERALSGDPDPRPQDPAALDGEQPDAAPEPAPREVCCGCGRPDVVYHNYRDLPFCRRCAASTTVTYGGHGYHPPKVEPQPEEPCFHPSWDTEPTVGARRCTDCGEWLDPEPPEPMPEQSDADLTADEARALADDLALQLYRADDALAFVAEMCDIADREGTPVTTTRVRDWLKGAQCARQAGLVLTRR